MITTYQLYERVRLLETIEGPGRGFLGRSTIMAREGAEGTVLLAQDGQSVVAFDAGDHAPAAVLNIPNAYLRPC